MRIGTPRGLAGVDIGSSAVKVVELKQGRQGYELLRFGMQALPASAAAGGAIADAPAVAATIRSIFDSQKIKSKEVVTAISGHSVIVKRISMPAMTDQELYDRIHTEAGQHIPFDIADVNVGYQVLEAGEERMDVLLVAAKKDKIQNCTEALAQAGKSARVLDVDAFALENCFEANYPVQLGEAVALLNIGASVMNMVIVRDGMPLFTRDVALGGNQYTDALQKELGLSYDDAERVKTGVSHPDVSEEQRNGVLRSVSETLVLEIQKTFDFFRATASAENLTHIYVAGGSARVPGLMELLKEDFGMPVTELNPFLGIAIRPGRHDEAQLRELGPRLAVAVGLAVRGAEGK